MKQIYLMLLLITISLLASAQVYDSGDMVGIGTTSPAEKLDVVGKIQSDYLRLNALSAQEGGELQLKGPDGYNDWRIDNRLGHFRLHHSGALHFQLNSDGNLGLGTQSPEAELHLHRPENAVNSATVDILLTQFDGASKISGLYTGTNKGGIAFSTENGTPDLVKERMRITADGKVGIGTSTPSRDLDVGGDIVSRTIEVGGDLEGQRLIYLHHWNVIAHQLRYHNGSLYLEGTTKYGSSNSTPNFLVGGKVGIGTTNPNAKLEVAGNIHSQEVKVTIDAGTGPDYVFEEDYDLTSLEEIEKFIKSEKHLPEVPSAKEMETNGVELGEMNMLLLKKIEELTLHLIEKNNEVTYQGQVIQKLQERVEKLENIIISNN